MVRAKGDGVVDFGSWEGGDVFTEADFDGFEGLDADDGEGESGVESLVVLGAGTESRGASEGTGFDESAEGIAVDFGLSDGGAHEFGGGGIRAGDPMGEEVAGVA